jgi:hypothetical protein
MFIKRTYLPAYPPELPEISPRAMKLDMAVLMDRCGGFATSALIDFVVFIDALAGSD